MVVKKNQKVGSIPQAHLTNREEVIGFLNHEVELNNCERGSISILSLDNQGKLIGLQRVSVSDLLAQRKEVLAGMLLSNGSSIIVADNYEHIETSKQFLNMFLDVTSALDFKMLDYINITTNESLANEIKDKIVYTEKYHGKYAPIDLESEYIKSNLHLAEDGEIELSEFTKETAISALSKELREYDTEYLCVLSLDKNDVPLGYNIISKGTTQETIADVKTTLKAPILSGAEKVVVLHNHTSYGLPSPSKEDDEVTFKLNNAFNMCSIKLEDHIIAGNMGNYSYEKAGRLESIKHRRFHPQSLSISADLDDISIGDKIKTSLSKNTMVIDIKESKFGDSKNAVLFDGRQYVAVTDIKYDINSEGYNWKEEHFCDTIAKAVAYQHTDDKSVEDVMSIYSDLNFKGFFTALVKSEMEIRNNEIIENAYYEFMNNDDYSLIDENIREIIENNIVKEYTCETNSKGFDYKEVKEKDDDIDLDY